MKNIRWASGLSSCSTLGRLVVGSVLALSACTSEESPNGVVDNASSTGSSTSTTSTPNTATTPIDTTTTATGTGTGTGAATTPGTGTGAATTPGTGSMTATVPPATTGQPTGSMVATGTTMPTGSGAATQMPTGSSTTEGGSPNAMPTVSGPGGGDTGTAGTSEIPGDTLPPTWIGAWGTSPQLTETNNNPPKALTNTTLRQVVFPTISGSKVRIELSNGFGNGPVEMQSVHLATAGEGSAIMADTDVALSFEGMPSVTIADGDTVWSDPIDFSLTALQKVAISIKFGAVPSEITGHPGSRTTSYIQDGDAVATASLGSATTTDHWYFITKLDTETTDPNSGAIVTFGDSITDGRGSTTNGNNRWPDGLARRLQADEATRNISVLNMGVGGNQILSGGLGPTGNDRYDRDVLGQSRVRWVIILHGINDVGNAGSDLTAQLTGAYQGFIDKAHAVDVKVFGSPLLPFAGSDYASNATHVTIHDNVNDWVKTSMAFDAVIDLAAAVAADGNAAQLDMAYLFENDYLHLNPQGYQAMADAIDLTLFQ